MEDFKKSISSDDEEGKAEARKYFIDNLAEATDDIDKLNFDFGLYAFDTGETISVGMVGSNKNISSAILNILTQNKTLFQVFCLRFIPLIKGEIVSSLAKDISEAEEKISNIRPTVQTLDPQGGNA